MKWRCFHVIEYDNGTIEIRRADSCSARVAPDGYVDCGVGEPLVLPNKLTRDVKTTLDHCGGEFES